LGLVQPLHGVTFALLHLACMRVIVLVVPLRLAATAQSVYGTLCIGLATALLTLASTSEWVASPSSSWLHSVCWRCKCVPASVHHRCVRALDSAISGVRSEIRKSLCRHPPDTHAP
jgi:hypothetical protein